MLIFQLFGVVLYSYLPPFKTKVWVVDVKVMYGSAENIAKILYLILLYGDWSKVSNT